jgi:hypothetical protein
MRSWFFQSFEKCRSFCRKCCEKAVFRSFVLVFSGVLMGMGFFAYISAGEIYDYTDSVDGVHLPQVDAIVCLAGGRGRIAAAGDIWYRYWELAQAPVHGAGRSPYPRPTPVLYISGMGRQSNWSVLTRQVRRGVLDVLTPVDVVLEKESSNTDENARWLARYAAEHGWERILLVTSSYHMKRARYIFERVLGTFEPPVVVETLSVYQEPFEPNEWREGLHGTRVTLIEYLKWVYYKIFWRV